MTSLVQQIGRLAIRTFRREPQLPEAMFKSQLEQLYSLVNRITAEDINLNPNLVSDQGQFDASRDGAPVTYMQVYEDNDFTICVFILKRGVRLPLHDHPGMYGMLKVIHGTVTVQSYSHTSGDALERGLQELLNARPYAGIFPASKHQRVTVSASDGACRLAPDSENMHEIHSVDGPAAFLDILSPPYGHDKRMGIERDCHYYQEIEGVSEISSNNITLLMSISSPTDFWCDQTDYTGPVIERVKEENKS